VGSGYLYRADADNNPFSACDGNEQYVDSDSSNSGGETDSKAKKTITLSNGTVA
jgi:hypothetical protein